MWSIAQHRDWRLLKYISRHLVRGKQFLWNIKLLILETWLDGILKFTWLTLTQDVWKTSPSSWAPLTSSELHTIQRAHSTKRSFGLRIFLFLLFKNFISQYMQKFIVARSERALLCDMWSVRYELTMSIHPLASFLSPWHIPRQSFNLAGFRSHNE